ncbi:MAG TPA: polysaccharide deacetylase family protein [Propionibacteriaceae bacterium]|nr:polysaccharide deacetylase family protein [Propionibacteriaceae bacterium]
MDRRRFLVGSAGALTAAVLGGCAGRAGMNVSGPSHAGQGAGTPSSSPSLPAGPTTPLVRPSVSAPPLPTTKGSIPSGQAITALTVPGPYMAWTIDDGTDPDVVAAYAQLAEQTGTRLTFFLNGNQPAWTKNAQRLLPLVQSGQVQLANHTWSHPDLRSLSAAGIQDQLQRNEDFIQSTYGVSAKPFYRPPFGYLNDRVKSAAAAIGYTAPTLWYGSLSDSSVLTSDQIAAFAEQYFAAGRVIIAHANHPGVIGAMQRLTDLIAQRGLRTVTLRDVFAT